MAADVLATQGARASAAMVLAYFARNIPEGLTTSRSSSFFFDMWRGCQVHKSKLRDSIHD